MNIHFQQVENKSQVFSYMRSAFAVFTVVMLTLSFSRQIELRLSVPSASMQADDLANTNVPVAVPAPLPPVEQAQLMVTPEPLGNSHTILAPQAIAAPMPSMP
jgi:hypothetical protein